MKDDVQPADYIDAAARGEFIRVGLGVLLVSFMNAHATLFSIIFARNGHDLHAIGVILSSAALPIIFFALISSEFSARIGVLGTLRLAMVLTIIGFASFYFTRASFSGAILSRFVQGAGQGLFLSAAITYGQSRLTPARLLYLLGVFSAMMPLSQALGPPVGEWTLAHLGENAMIDRILAHVRLEGPDARLLGALPANGRIVCALPAKAGQGGDLCIVVAPQGDVWRLRPSRLAPALSGVAAAL